MPICPTAEDASPRPMIMIMGPMTTVGSTRSIQQIAVACGYSNAKFFSTVFMKYEGVTPTDYRNMYGGIHQNNA